MNRRRKRPLGALLATCGVSHFGVVGPACGASAALVFGSNPLPPSVRLALGQEGALRRDCEAAAKKNKKGGAERTSAVGAGGGDDDEDDPAFAWERDAREGFQVARCLFGAVAGGPPPDRRGAGDDEPPPPGGTKRLWFPAADDSEMVSALADVVRSNSDRLGGVAATAGFWPDVPATCVELRWPSSSGSGRSEGGGVVRPEEATPPSSSSSSSAEAAVKATERWVDETLGGLSLCPYTRSLRRAAAGLASVGVEEGPVGVRHSCRSTRAGRGATDAALLAAAFWDGVAELASAPEADLSTLLVVAPPAFDADFVGFASICDELLEPAVRAAGADAVVGKAWFHPLYEASTIGHQELLPGHALPSSMVEKFVETYYGDYVIDGGEGPTGAKAEGLSSEDIARANNEVRHTPHATVNLLRRSQLRAAKEAEAASAVKRPNAIYARNVIRIASEWNSKSR